MCGRGAAHGGGGVLGRGDGHRSGRQHHNGMHFVPTSKNSFRTGPVPILYMSVAAK